MPALHPLPKSSRYSAGVTSLFALLFLPAAPAQTISLANILDSYAWGAASSRSGTYALNIWDDATGAALAADNGDAPDITISFSTSLGALGNGGWEYTSADTLRASQGFSGAVAANNPGSRVTNTVTILFASHISITDLNTDFTSLNSAGLCWETSRLALLQPDGSYFSTAPTLSSYLDYTAIEGYSATYPGFYFSDSKATVKDVGTANTASGSVSGALENLTGTNGNSILNYADVGLAPGTSIGGFEWTTVLEDTRGTSNANTSSFTSTMTSFAVSGSMLVPEPAGVLLLAASLPLGWARRRRE